MACGMPIREGECEEDGRQFTNVLEQLKKFKDPGSPSSIKSTAARIFSVTSSGKRCYKCKRIGHIRSQCKIKDEREVNYKVALENLNQHLASLDLDYLKEIEGKCFVDGKMLEYLLDCGATRTIIHSSHFENNDLTNLKEAKFSAFAANGEQLKINGIKKCRFELGDFNKEAEVLISDDIGADCILGMDIISTCPAYKDLIAKLLYRTQNIAFKAYQRHKEEFEDKTTF